MEQKPSIGRIVHVANDAGNVCAAIIINLREDSSIDVQRFDRDGGLTHLMDLKKVHYPPKGTLDWNWPARIEFVGPGPMPTPIPTSGTLIRKSE